MLWVKLASQYEIKHSEIKTSLIIDHNARSVVKIQKNSLIERKSLMLAEALNDKSITEYYGNKIRYFKENTYSYISLHLILAGYKKEGFQYFIKAIKTRPLFLFSKRAMAIIKHFIF